MLEKEEKTKSQQWFTSMILMQNCRNLFLNSWNIKFLHEILLLHIWYSLNVLFLYNTPVPTTQYPVFKNRISLCFLQYKSIVERKNFRIFLIYAENQRKRSVKKVNEIHSLYFIKKIPIIKQSIFSRNLNHWSSNLKYICMWKVFWGR